MSNGSGLFDNSPLQERFIRGGGVRAEVGDLRGDLSALSALAAVTVDEYIDAEAGAADALLAAAATVAAEVVLGPEDLDTGVQTDMALTARQLLFTTAGATPADAPADVAIVGTDAQGKVISETLVLAQTATTAASVNYYASITSITYPAADGTAATVAIGTTANLGLRQPLKSRAGASVLLGEVEDGAAVTTGALILAATALPYGAYTPATVPDGAVDYAIYYEFDPTA